MHDKNWLCFQLKSLASGWIEQKTQQQQQKTNCNWNVRGSQAEPNTYKFILQISFDALRHDFALQNSQQIIDATGDVHNSSLIFKLILIWTSKLESTTLHTHTYVHIIWNTFQNRLNAFNARFEDAKATLDQNRKRNRDKGIIAVWILWGLHNVFCLLFDMNVDSRCVNKQNYFGISSHIYHIQIPSNLFI